MRTFIVMIFVLASVVALGERNHWWAAEERFITLPDREENERLVARRQQCGDMRHVIALLHERIGDDKGEEREILYAELVGEVVGSLKSDGTIPQNCVSSEDASVTVLLSTDGDMFVGLAGRAITSWADQIRLDRTQTGKVAQVEKEKRG